MCRTRFKSPLSHGFLLLADWLCFQILQIGSKGYTMMQPYFGQLLIDDAINKVCLANDMSPRLKVSF